MQEETTQKTIALAIKTSKLTASVLQKAMKMYLEHQKHKEPSHGKIPVKKLVGQGAGAKSIEVTDDNIKAFERVARKYNVDFAVRRDKTTEPPKYLVFFKGKDADVIAQAFKEFIKVNEKKQQRPSLRQHDFGNIQHFSDDGYSGTNFNRPAFNFLLIEIEAGRVGTVIVKDMSRFGRNYLQVGFHTEMMFPKKNVRFIAVNNGVDSANTADNDFTPFLNIMNDNLA